MLALTKTLLYNNTCSGDIVHPRYGYPPYPCSRRAANRSAPSKFMRGENYEEGYPSGIR